MVAPSDFNQHCMVALEERPLGGARKMAAPSTIIEDTVNISSEEEGDEQGCKTSADCGVKGIPDGFCMSKEGRMIPWVPRVVSPMLHKVQAWEVDIQAVFKVGEQVEFVDSSGMVLRGTTCGEASGDGKAGRAQDRLDFWQSGQGEGLSGCDNPHVLGGHKGHAVHQQLGRPAGGKTLPVRVGAPFGHRVEGRVKPGAVYLTSQEASRHGVLGHDDCPGVSVRISTLLTGALVQIWST
ncbi:hypothetical protein NDU88_002562 [Pleurodeles waltl]|uniref:Uncharacterized protein n=1 Tax=Pleurodeles waltl TaxID=8319 RepID=A0AAV7VAW4_PLEWA|nr:hypothetical protein NDU88_002562 [Pleurodeles waltl]